MLLKRTIAQLDIGYVPAEQAREMGQMGYMQWLGALPGRASYVAEARRARAMALPFARTSPAVAVFCQLLEASAATPLAPLDLSLPARTRRGGARARRGGVI